MQKFIDQIYEKTISDVLKDIPENYQEEVKKSYKNVLFEKYHDIAFEEKSTEKIVNHLVDLELSLWKNMNFLARLSYLIKDDALQKISFISNLGLENAEKRLNDNILMNELESNSYIKLMNEQLERIKPFNVVLAKNYISEGTADFKYACGTTDDTSLRVGRYR